MGGAIRTHGLQLHLLRYNTHTHTHLNLAYKGEAVAYFPFKVSVPCVNSCSSCLTAVKLFLLGQFEIEPSFVVKLSTSISYEQEQWVMWPVYSWNYFHTERVDLHLLECRLHPRASYITKCWRNTGGELQKLLIIYQLVLVFLFFFFYTQMHRNIFDQIPLSWSNTQWDHLQSTNKRMSALRWTNYVDKPETSV